MIKYFASLIRGDAMCEHSKPVMRCWWWPVSLKAPVLGADRSRVALPPVFILKKAKNVMDAKNNNFHFLRF